MPTRNTSMQTWWMSFNSSNCQPFIQQMQSWRSHLWRRRRDVVPLLVISRLPIASKDHSSIPSFQISTLRHKLWNPIQKTINTINEEVYQCLKFCMVPAFLGEGARNKCMPCIFDFMITCYACQRYSETTTLELNSRRDLKAPKRFPNVRRGNIIFSP